MDELWQLKEIYTLCKTYNFPVFSLRTVRRSNNKGDKTLEQTLDEILSMRNDDDVSWSFIVECLFEEMMEPLCFSPNDAKDKINWIISLLRLAYPHVNHRELYDQAKPHISLDWDHDEKYSFTQDEDVCSEPELEVYEEPRLPVEMALTTPTPQRMPGRHVQMAASETR
jgi:hypothetical protein